MKKKTINYFEKRILELEEEGCEWNQEDTREKMIEQATRFFDKGIKEVSWRDRSKIWHQNVQKFCGYSSKTGLLNLNRGPIADIDDVQEMKEGTRHEDEVRIYENRKEILL